MTKANFTSNFEDMLALPGQHVLDKIILIMEFSANGERLLPKLVSKLEHPAPKGYFEKKSTRINQELADPNVKSAIARYYLRQAMADPAFNPEEIPAPLQGLKECWSLACGVDSMKVLELVQGVGYEALCGVEKSVAREPVQVVGAEEFQTEDEVKDALVLRVAGMLQDAHGQVATAQVRWTRTHEKCVRASAVS